MEINDVPASDEVTRAEEVVPRVRAISRNLEAAANGQIDMDVAVAGARKLLIVVDEYIHPEAS